jgi:hypothetical protein
MAERVQASVAVVATEEAAQKAAEDAVNDILEQGHRLVGDPEIRAVEIGGEPMYSVWITYDRLSPEEIAAEQQAAAEAAEGEEVVAAAAAAAVAPRKKGLWWKVGLGVVPLAAAVGVVAWWGVERVRGEA